MKISNQISIDKVDQSWVVRGGYLKKTTFTRLRHACQYVVDTWAGEAAKECQSTNDVLEHVGERLHDAITLLGKERTKLMLIDVEGLEKDRERLDWLIATRERGGPQSREDIDAAMEHAAGVRESEV